MKLYAGSRSHGDWYVTVQGDGAMHPLVHYKRHSPTGFSWGYSGSGPAELARCILIDHFDVHEYVEQFGDALYADVQLLPVNYQDFKSDVISRFPQDGSWTLSSLEVDAWVGRYLRECHHDAVMAAASEERRERVARVTGLET